MTRAEAEKIVWDFAGLNREVEALMAWNKLPSRALQTKLNYLAEKLVMVLMKEANP